MSSEPSNYFSSLFQILVGYRGSQLLAVAAKINLANYLEKGAKTCEELAQLTATHPDPLYRFLRAATGLGLVAEQGKGTFELTEMGAFLSPGHPQSLRDLILFLGSEERWKGWGDLLYSLQTGQPAFEHVFGVELFDYYTAHPEAGEIHDRAMTALSKGQLASILEAYDFSGFKRVADIGGGNGRLISAVLSQNQGVRGVLFDLPEVVGRAKALLEAEGVADRCEIVGGSFFENVPGGCDAYLLRQVIHDWDDTRATQILSRCRQAMPPGSKILIFGWVLPEKVVAAPGYNAGHWLDLEMLVSTPRGRERTEAEFNRLLEAAKLKLVRIVPTKSGQSIVEALPI